MQNKFDADDVRLSMYALGELDQAEREAVELLLATDGEARMFVDELRNAATALESGLKGEAKPALSAEQRAEVELAARRTARKLEPIPWVRYALAAGVAATFIGGALALWKPWRYGATRSRVEGFVAQTTETGVRRSGERTAVTESQPGQPDPKASVTVVDAIEAKQEIAAPGAVPQDVGLVRQFGFSPQSAQPFVGGDIRVQSNPTNSPWPLNQSLTLEGRLFFTWSDTNAVGPATGASPLQPFSSSVGTPPGWQLESPPSGSSHYVISLGGDLRSSVAPLVGMRVDTEAYEAVAESAFKLTRDDPLSTFSIDVDTASYSNMRRFLRDGQKPPADSVRIEEWINYFEYDYPQPVGAIPFSVTTDVTPCPWNTRHQLLRIGLQGRDVMRSERNPSNLVFLIDVSGSMDDARKLPLVVRSLKMLAEELDGRDSIGIVVYAGSSGLVLDSTSVRNRAVVLDALERLRAGGSTNGGEGIQLAYKLAREHFIAGGTNRVILCTDGDFNVGLTSQEALVELIEEQRKSGVFLSVLGFGTGNLKDATMEQLADKGNGHYAYIDSMTEARKVLVDQIGGTLETIAKDVKIQLELNPAKVQAWRLVGYENRVLAHRDFNDDTKDAGEIGAGHTVTALYEIVPSGVAFEANGVDALRYQPTPQFEREPGSDELCFVKLRYKAPDADESRLISQVVRATPASERASDDQRFAAAVAMFGMKLRASPYTADVSFADIEKLAASALGHDRRGLRIEFVDLVRRAAELP